MNKFVTSNVGIEITVSEFLGKGKLSDAIIFYHTSREYYPVFLKQIDMWDENFNRSFKKLKYAFVSPVFSYVSTFIADTPEESITLAMKTRQVFAIKKDEWRILFNFIGSDVE